jgi:uncharacterized protein (TIGR03067 family)
MKTSRIGALALAVAAALPSAARAQAVSGDLAKIQGHWWTRFTPAGGARPIVQSMDINGDVISGTNDNGNTKSVGRIKLNESASLRTIDYVDTVVTNKTIGEIKMHDTFGIYETDGQTLKIALNSGILNSKRPTAFQFDYKLGISVLTWHRGEPTPEEMPRAAAKAKAAEKPAHVERTASFPGATVEGIVDRKIHFRTADGKQFVTGVQMGRVLDAQGKPYQPGLYFMWPGNTVDVTVVYADKPNQLDQIKEVRLVRGKVERIVLENIAPTGRMNGAPASKKANSRVTYLPPVEGAGATYKGALITKVHGPDYTLDVGGQTVQFHGGGDRSTESYDLQGSRLPVGYHQRLLKAGNKVDLEFRPKRNPNDPKESLVIRSIRLVEGKVGDPIQYLNSPPVQR